MEIRAATTSDLAQLREIDGTIESTQYIHLDQSGEALARAWSLQKRPLREKLIATNHPDEDAGFMARQIISGADEGLALLAEHETQRVAFLLAQPVPAMKVLKLLDVRVDYDFRRQGIGMAMVFQAIAWARDQELRAVQAETLANNVPAAEFLTKCSFELCGVDTRRRTNHDVVRESSTLIWYVSLD